MASLNDWGMRLQSLSLSTSTFKNPHSLTATKHCFSLKGIVHSKMNILFMYVSVYTLKKWCYIALKVVIGS